MITNNIIDTKLLTDDEITVLAKLCDEFYTLESENTESSEVWNQANFKRSIESYKNRTSYCVRLYDNQELIGFIFLLNVFEGCWISNIETDVKKEIDFSANQKNAGIFSYGGIIPSYRSKGYGSLLLDLGLQKFKDMNYKKLILFGFITYIEHSFYSYKYADKIIPTNIVDYNGYKLFYVDI